MNMAVRRFFLTNPILRQTYLTTRKVYHHRRMVKGAQAFIEDIDEYRKALRSEDGKLVNVHTKDGLTITIRRNCMDATILAEIFLDNCYARGLSLTSQPVVIDIGGYIGDFALYAVKHLNARKVVVCEPSPDNWRLLRINVTNNHCEDRIEIVNKAVTDGHDVLMNVDAPGRVQARVSAYYDCDNPERKLVPGVTLARLVEEYGLGEIDLLKIDCEGGEYEILSTMPRAIGDRIRNIVFEYHEIDGFVAKLTCVKQRLCDEGYTLRTHGSLVFATRK